MLEFSAMSRLPHRALLLPLVALLPAGSACRGGGTVDVALGRVTRRAVFRSTVTASGEIVAVRYADIGSSIMGKLVALPVKEGERVRRGQVVARIDAVPAASEAAAAAALVRAADADERVARARLEDTTKALARIRELRAQGLVPQADLDVAQAAAREFKVKVRVKGGEAGLRPGLTCDADILVGEAKDALTVPLQAVVLRGEPGQERPGVFTVEAGLARFVPVETGTIGGLEIG